MPGKHPLPTFVRRAQKRVSQAEKRVSALVPVPPVPGGTGRPACPPAVPAHSGPVARRMVRPKARRSPCTAWRRSSAELPLRA
jgi:hypothetical protein